MAWTCGKGEGEMSHVDPLNPRPWLCLGCMHIPSWGATLPIILLVLTAPPLIVGNTWLASWPGLGGWSVVHGEEHSSLVRMEPRMMAGRDLPCTFPVGLAGSLASP